MVYRAGEDADDTQVVVGKGLGLMANKVEYMTLQLKRSNDGDLVEQVSGKNDPRNTLHNRPLIMALDELTNKEGWEVVTIYSSNSYPNILLKRSIEESKS